MIQNLIWVIGSISAIFPNLLLSYILTIAAPGDINLNGINGIAEIAVIINPSILFEIQPMYNDIVQGIYGLIHA